MRLPLLKSALRLLECYTFILHLKSKTIKIFNPFNKTSQVAELSANKAALKAGFWKDRVVKVNPGFLILRMKRGKSIALKQSTLVETYLDESLYKALAYPHQPVNTQFDFNKILKLEPYGLKIRKINKAKEILKYTKLPSTSAHGDLHMGNMIELDGKLKIIDWSMYNRNGSFITDYIHYFIHKDAQSNKYSWTRAILKDNAPLNRLSLLLNININILKLTYAISRIHGEISQLQKLHLISERQIQKYNFVLKKLIKNASMPCLVL